MPIGWAITLVVDKIITLVLFLPPARQPGGIPEDTMRQPRTLAKAAPYGWGQLIFDALATTFVIGVWGAVSGLLIAQWLVPATQWWMP